MIQRVAMISVHTCPLATLGGKETGGMNVYVRDLTRELARRRIAVDVYTRSQNPAIPRVSGRRRLGGGARVVHIPAGPEQPLNKNLVFDYLPEFVAHVQEFAQCEGLKYDIIHSHYWLSGWAARELRANWHVPIVHMFHTLGYSKNLIAAPEERESEWRIEVERQIMQFADCLIAATPLEKSDMVTAYGADESKIVVVPPGVDRRLFRPIPRAEAQAHFGMPPKHHMVLFVGRIQPLKGIDTLFRAMKLVVEQFPNWREDLCVCIIGGDPSDSSETELQRLYQLRDELGISDLVIFMGARDQDSLVWHYSAADVVVMPSHYESFGMVALEAMACGTPVIGADVGGLSFSIQNGYNGFLVPGRDPQALADKILLILKHPFLRDQLGEQALRTTERYDWHYIAEEILEVYALVLSRRSAPQALVSTH
ncbi:MAG: glycosyltransferase [Anaerolineae bacterium]